MPLLKVAGDIDIGTVDAFARALREAADLRAHEVCLDLGEVTFFDVSAYRALLAADCDFTARGCRLILRRPSSSVKLLLEVVGAGPFTVMDDPDGPRMGAA